MRLKYLKIAIALSTLLVSCDNIMNEPIYIYNSKEYHQKIKEFSITIDEAAKITNKYLNKKNIKGELVLDIVLGDYYIFPRPRLYNLKTTQYSLSGIWINGKTGKLIDKKTNNIKVLLKIPSTNTTKYILKIK